MFVLKEMRNQCAHLELITRFKLKRKQNLNNFNDITAKAKLTRGKQLFYMDVLKIFKLFGSISDIKRVIVSFYLGMTMKGRMRIAEKVISKMGRKKITVWMKL